MEHIFNLIEMDHSNSKIKVSITESTMMQILHCAMDKAYQKVKSNNGVLERLNEISKFYELAVIQLEGCLKFVQEETDKYVLDSSHEMLLEDLTEIRNRLQGRLKELEMAISDKDKELMERLGIELKLRKELDSLHAAINLEQKKKNEGIEDLLLSSQASSDSGDREGEFCELKNSVDQQVWNIQQQLEPRYQLIDEERSKGIDNKKIEQMGSDIGILKETLDLAFCKMKNAMFLCELGPIEHQWMWNIERGIAAIVIKGFMRDVRENFEVEVKNREMQVSVGLRKHLSDVVREVSCLNHELQLLNNPDQSQSKSSKPKPSLTAKGKSLSEGQNLGDLTNFPPKVEEASTIKQPRNEDSQDDGSHYVAKMIKNHESIIRQKSEELMLLTRELPEKALPPLKKETDSGNPKRRIQKVIVSLESLIKWNPGVADSFGHGKNDYEAEKHHEESLFTDKGVDIGKSGVESMEEVWAKVNKTSVSQVGKEKACSEMTMLKQEMEDANLQTLMLEETYLSILKSLVDEFRSEMLNNHLHTLIKEGMYEKFIEEMKDEWEKNTREERIKTQSREEKAVKNPSLAHNSKEENYQNAKAESNCFEDQKLSGFGELEDMLKKDVYTYVLQEMLREWNENIKTAESINSLGEELCFVVFGETLRDIMSNENYATSKLQKIKVPDSFDYDFETRNTLFESLAVSIKDDVWKVYLNEMIKELEMEIYAFRAESLIREEVNQFVIVEAVKEPCMLEEVVDQNRARRSSNSLVSINEVCTNLGGYGKENMTLTLDKLVKFLEDEESLIQSACSEIKQHKIRLDLVELVSGELAEHEHFQKLLTNEQNSSTSAINKVEKALQQLDFGKALLSEFGSQLGIRIGNLEPPHKEMAPAIATTHCSKPIDRQAKYIEEEKINKYESLLTPIRKLSQTLKSFECASATRLGVHILRLDGIKLQLDLVFKLTASLTQKESLYRKAFIRRCENLQLAETEVDLLGDQVDRLEGLLKKIYITLHQYSPVLQHYFEVSEILKLIETEMGGR